MARFRFANLAGRAVLVNDSEYWDLEQATHGSVSSDPMAAISMATAINRLAPEILASTPSGTYDPHSLLAPVPTPSKVFAIGLNYTMHAEESAMEVPENPVVFTKFPSCITGPFSPVVMRGHAVDYEAEVVVVIGKGGRDIPRESAWEHVFGITGGQDVSDRVVQFASKPPHFDLGKSFDTYGPIGPVVVSPDSFQNRDAIELSCSVNGDERQRDSTHNLIFDVPTLIEYISRVTTLVPGDLIFTGTPAGVGASSKRFLTDGDIIVTNIEGVGTMSNTCHLA
jgi:2,4-diketo-3-deoxy-L-fuconate hydrolase